MIIIVKGRKKFANYLNIGTSVYVGDSDELQEIVGISVSIDADKNITSEYTLDNGEVCTSESLETEKARELNTRKESVGVGYVLDGDIKKHENTSLCAKQLGITKNAAKSIIDVLWAEKMLADAKAKVIA